MPVLFAHDESLCLAVIDEVDRPLELRLCQRAVEIALNPRSRQGAHGPVAANPANPMVVAIGHVNLSTRSNCQPGQTRVKLL